MAKLTLKQLRAGTEYKQTDVANALGVNIAVYQAWETLSDKDVEKLAEFFKVSPSDILVPRPLKQI